jgi:hypothetical protein
VSLDDGSFVSLEARPAEELEALGGRRVAAAGKLVVPAEPSGEPAMASPIPVPTLVEISAVEPLD